MKAVTVERIVNAVAEWHAARDMAQKETHTPASLAMRATASETLVETLIDAMLEGTSADPDRKKR